MSDVDRQPYLPDYASYNWTGAPSNTSFQTNSLGGDSRMLRNEYLIMVE